jgi:5'-nucleotidase
MRRWICLVLGLSWAEGAWTAEITITLLHNNDLHARVEQTLIQGQPYGGVARIGALVEQIRRTDRNVVLLNAGDTFQGTLYFQAYGGLADLWFKNRIGYDAMALGNHEFDKGPGPLAEFVDRARFPILSANVDVSQEPTLRGKISPYTVIEVGGEKLGVIGATTEDTPTISSPGPTVAFRPPREPVISAVRALELQGVHRIILLSHLGYAADRELARTLDGLDVVVGGHSHTLLGAFDRPGLPEPEGTYPTVVRGPRGDVLVVQAWQWGKVLGKLRLTFDARGRVRSWAGSRPILVDRSIPEDPFLLAMVQRFQRPIEALRRSVIGQTEVLLDGSRDATRRGEATMAAVIADGFLEATARMGAVAGFINAGGVRASLEAGPVTYEQAITVQPFGNTLTVLDLTGAELLAALEHGVSRLPESGGGMLLPSAGFEYAVDLARLPGQRVVSATLNGEPVDAARTYRIVTGSFTANGGDGHAVLANARGYRMDTGLLDVDVLVATIRARSPLRVAAEQRVRFVLSE